MEDHDIELNYGQTFEDTKATLKFVSWYKDKYYPNRSWKTHEHQFVLQLFREFMILLSLKLNRAVSRKETFELILNMEKISLSNLIANSFKQRRTYELR